MQSNCSKKCAAGSPCGDCSGCAAAAVVPKEANIRIPAGEYRDTPIVLPVAETINVTVGAGTTALIIEPAIGPACAGIDKSELHFQLDEGASLRFVSIRECAAHGEKSYRSSFALDKGAKVSVVECRLGGGNISASAQIDLNGEEATASFRSALFAAESDKLQSKVNVNHFASRTTSRIITKGVLADKARIEYRGLTSIDGKTVGCVGEQHADALLLSSNARVDLMPDLKIDANDVRCGHGSTVSGLDEHKLYYLMSRGLSRASAMEAAARGFMADALSELNEEEIELIEQILTPRLKCALNSIKV